MGPVEAGDVFTPGELLKIALAGCAGMSSDHTLARHLGADVPVTVHVAGIKHPGEERYPALHEELVAGLIILMIFRLASFYIGTINDALKM